MIAGTVLTASAHIITAVIGSGVLSLAWATAQLGWLFGPLTLFLFAMITMYTSSLLTDCYRTPDPVTGTRNYTYMAAVRANLGKSKVWFCGLCQYANLFGTGIGYTITASISCVAVRKSNCYHKNGHNAECMMSATVYMVCFGLVQVVLSQLPNLHNIWWVSIVAAVMSFAYASIAVGLSIAQIISGPIEKGYVTGTKIGEDVTAAGKVWSVFQALGDIAFAYSYAMLLIEIQDTLRSRPAENKAMKKASRIGISTTTVFYALSGCLGYAAFGNRAPGNILTGFGFFEPFWLIDLANVAIIIHLLGAYQLYLQPVFAAVETAITRRWPDLGLLSHEYQVVTSKNCNVRLNLFRLVWRTVFVAITTLLAILMPFFNDILAFLGALGFWPLTVFFPVEMYMAKKQVPRFSPKWIALHTLSFMCFWVSLAAACGSVAGVVTGLRKYRPFHTKF